jgi:hypothetical protein
MDGTLPLLAPPEPSCTVVAKPHPLRSESVYAEVKAGQTLLQMLGEGASHALEVRVGGEAVPREWWGRLKPKAGQYIHVQMYPQGGNAGKWVRTILLVVVAIVAIWVTGGGAAGLLGSAFASGTTGAALLGAAIGIVGSLAINALIPPPTPKGLNGASSDPFKQLNSITGTSNQANPYGVIPCVVGTMRFFPPHAALPYTEISGDDQYLRMLLDLGYGDLDVSDIQIGGTDIASFEDVEYEIGTSPGLFTQDVFELAVSTDLSTDGATDTRTTQTASDEISLDLVFSNGLFGVNSSGQTTTGTVTFLIQYAPAGSGTWTNVTLASGLTSTNGLIVSGSNFTVSSSARQTLRCGIRWKVTAGQYDVKVTRVSSSFPGSAGTSAQSGACAWSVLRSVAYHVPSTTGTSKLAMRIKATGQLNGVVQNLSVLAAQKIPQWDKTTQSWTANAETQNQGWIYAWLLTRCPAVLRRLADSRLDLDTIADFAAECDAKGLVCSFVMDSGRALFDVVRDVLASGRGSFGMRNGLYSVVRDVAQTVPVQIFTPANSWGFSYMRVFSDLPHALRVKFTNPEASYQQDEIVVYWDGYSSDGAGGTTVATRFEELDLAMVVDPGAAWKLGRYHLAVAYNRPNTYTLNADIESVICERGDLVYAAHDITHWGADWGRITAVSANGLTVTLDGPVTLESGVSYNFRVRHADGSQVTGSVTNAAGTTQVITLSTAIATSDVGNLFVLGDVNQGVAALIVKQIDPGTDLSAQLTLVDAAPAVLDADSGTPPSFTSAITGQSWCAAPDPPQLDLIVTGTPDDAGTFQHRTGVSIPPQPGILRGGNGLYMRRALAG